MAIARVPVPEAVEAAPPGAVARWLAATREFCRVRTLGAVGAAVIVVMFAVALLAPVLSSYDPEAVDFGAMLARPSLAHWLGTDSSGATCSRGSSSARAPRSWWASALRCWGRPSA